MVEDRESNPTAVDYLKRNEKLIAELTDYKVQLGERGGSSNNYAFYQAGSYFSETAGRKIFTGVKVRSRKQNLSQIQNRFVRELSIMSAIAKNIPHLAEELPLFYGLLVNKEGQAVGMITEDFSERGRYVVNNSSSLDAAYEIKNLFFKDSVHDEDIVSAGFRVNGRRRLGDFSPFGSSNFWEQNGSILERDVIERELDKYTLRLDYDFV